MSLGLGRTITQDYRGRVYYCSICVSDLQLGTFLKNYLHCVPRYSYQCWKLLLNTCGYESLVSSQWFPTQFRNGPQRRGRRSGLSHIFAHGVIDITGKDDFLPFLVNLKHSKAARLGAARIHDAAARLQIPCWVSYQAGCKKNGVPGVCGGFNMSGNVLTHHI